MYFERENLKVVEEDVMMKKQVGGKEEGEIKETKKKVLQSKDIEIVDYYGAFTPKPLLSWPKTSWHHCE